MQKKLIAAAIAGLASAGAFAQMNVTVYGQIDLSVSFESGNSLQQTKNVFGDTNSNAAGQSGVGNVHLGGASTFANFGTNGQRTAMRSGLYRGSYVGFKGTEDLGGGMKLDFVVESDVNAAGDTAGAGGQAAPSVNTQSGAGAFGNAESSLALTTNFGRFKFGRMQNFLATALASADPYFGKGPGGVEQMIVQPLATTQASNSIRYDIAASGFFGGYQIAMSENQDKVQTPLAGAGAPGGGTISVFWAGYKDGPIFALAGQGIAREYANAAGMSTANQGKQATVNVLAGTYDFGVAKAHAMWTTTKSKRANTGTTCIATSTACDDVALIDARTYMVGVTVPMGPHAFKLSYVNTKDKRPYDLSGNSLTGGYEYDFSKRTKFYSRLARVANSNGAPFGVVVGGGQIVADSQALGYGVSTNSSATIASANRTNAFTVGMQHSF